MPSRHPDASGLPATSIRKGISGQAVVFSMFGLAIVATGILWTYWTLHLTPFMPLQKAIFTEFEDSAPRVDGGQRKIHKETESYLRLVMRIPFDPNSEEPKEQAELERIQARIGELAKQNADMTPYEMMEFNFYHEVTEKELQQRKIRRSLSDWSVVE